MDYMERFPAATAARVKEAFPDANPRSLYEYRKQAQKIAEERDASQNPRPRQAPAPAATTQAPQLVAPNQIQIPALPEGLQRILGITMLARQAGIDDWKPADTLNILTRFDELDTRKTTFYERPDWLYAHQVVFGEIARRGNVFIEGPRQGPGKTVGMHVFNIEDQIEHDNWVTSCISVSKELSRELFIKKIKHERRLLELYEPFGKMLLSETYTLKNGSGNRIFPLKERSVQGPTSNTIWIDELDKIISEPGGRETLAAILPQLLVTMTNGKGKLWITCNKGERQYEPIKRVFMEIGYPFFPVLDLVKQNDGSFEVVIVNKHIESPDFESMSIGEKRQFIDVFMYKLLEALHGEAYAKRMILGLADYSKDPWPPDLIEKCFEPFEKPTNFSRVTLSVDPGFYHAMDCLILGEYRGQAYELWHEQYVGTKQDFMEAFSEILEKCRELGVHEAFIEPNSAGLMLMQFLNSHGISATSSGFGTGAPSGLVTNETKLLERAYYERLLRHVAGEGLLHLTSREIKDEWFLYNPSKDKEKSKGDAMDSLLINAFHVFGGIPYLLDVFRRMENGNEGNMLDDEIGISG